MFKYINLSIAFVCCCILGCASKNEQQLSVHFSPDSSKIVIAHIEPVGLFQIKSNLNDTTYQNLVSVLQTPGENNSLTMEMDWPGKLTITGDSLLFTPQQAFVKGQFYLVETIINTHFAATKDIVKSDIGKQVKAQQVLLQR